MHQGHVMERFGGYFRLRRERPYCQGDMKLRSARKEPACGDWAEETVRAKP